MPDTLFDLSRFENLNGTISWRVTGNLHGLRVRKNFKTRAEASAEPQTPEIQSIQSTTGVRTTATRLSEE
jgi:hypothetical protein